MNFKLKMSFVFHLELECRPPKVPPGQTASSAPPLLRHCFDDSFIETILPRQWSTGTCHGWPTTRDVDFTRSLLMGGDLSHNSQTTQPHPSVYRRRRPYLLHNRRRFSRLLTTIFIGTSLVCCFKIGE